MTVPNKDQPRVSCCCFDVAIVLDDQVVLWQLNVFQTERMFIGAVSEDGVPVQ